MHETTRQTNILDLVISTEEDMTFLSHERKDPSFHTKGRINNEETVAEYTEAKRQVKRIVIQEKRNKELNIARIFKHNPKSFYSYITERKIVRDNIWPLKTLDGIVITTDNDMANTMNNYFKINK